MAKKSGDGDRLLSFAAIFISLLTLGVFVYQTNLIRKQQYMSVYPHLSLGHIGLHTENYRLVLANEGIGPALIHSIIVKYDNKILDESLRNYLGNRTNRDSVHFYYADISEGRLIPAGEYIELIGTADEKIDTGTKINELLDEENFSYEIVYKSIYEERWKIWFGGTAPLKLN